MPGVCVLGDKAKVSGHMHGGPCCPHTAMGPAISGSADVLVNGLPALRLGDMGMHAACCGPNTWQVIEASGRVYVNGQPLVRKGDKTRHCGVTVGEMIEASGDVNDNSPRAALIQQKLETIARAAMTFNALADGYAPGPGEDPALAQRGPQKSFLAAMEKVSPYLELARHTAEGHFTGVSKQLAADAKVIQKFQRARPTSAKEIKAWRQARSRFYRQQAIERAGMLERSGQAAKAARILSRLGTGLNVATAGLHGFLQYRDSKNATRGGRIAQGTAAGVFNGIYGAALPGVAAVDAITGGHGAQNLDGSAGAISSLGELVVTGKRSGAEAFNEASKRGEYGPVFQAASNAGEYWAQHGVVGGITNFLDNL